MLHSAAGFRTSLATLLLLVAAIAAGCGRASSSPPKDAAASREGSPDDASISDTGAGKDANADAAANAEAGVPSDDGPGADAPNDVGAIDGGGAGYGEICTADGVTPCAAGLICLWAPTNNYFCTRTCTVQGQPCLGAPSGTKAFCLVTDATPDGKGGCAFVCAEPGHVYQCPPALTCQATDDPPGSGQRTCLP